MAEEQAIEPEIPQPQPQARPVRGLLVFVLVLLISGIGGYWAYLNFFQEKPVQSMMANESAQTAVSPQVRQAAGVMFPLEPFLVNLSKSKGKRFLKVTLTLELSSPGVKAEVDENIKKILDSILILLSSKTFEQVISVQGKFRLKDEVTTRVNRFLVLGHVKNVYFSEFVIQ